MDVFHDLQDLKNYPSNKASFDDENEERKKDSTTKTLSTGASTPDSKTSGGGE
jgi:hypothetical protein